ncbi:hypothetical protein [Ornithinibacillus contaminans]|uniref:hypothetical protein n=1 Tax=Ornithinibacillus contaminans TaxID=694055 RepID=UPI0012EDE9C6|nr:hypothetical protein [Ornithinibacillus contaminans]
MNLLIWSVMITMFLYTAGFSITLWKEKNKLGSIAVFLMAISIVITPFFTVLR